MFLQELRLRIVYFHQKTLSNSMGDNQIHQLVAEIQGIKDKLDKGDHIDESNNFNKIIVKQFIISSACTLECDFKEMIILVFSTLLNNRISPFIEKTLTERNYHKLFNWDSHDHKGMNTFFSYFGADFKQYMMRLTNDNLTMGQSFRDFLYIGKCRNELLHNDYLNNSLYDTLTVLDMQEKFISAYKTIDFTKEHVVCYIRNGLT